MLLALRQFFNLLPFPLIVVLIHLIVRLVPEGLEGHKLAGILHISEWLDRPPVLVMIILEHKRLLGAGLLNVSCFTSLTKLWTFSLIFSFDISLSSA